MKNTKAYILGVLAQIIWAGSVIFAKDALKFFTPLTLVTARFVLAIVFMFILGMLVRRLAPDSPLALSKLKSRDLPLFALAGMLQPFLYFIFEIYAIKLISSPTMAEAILSTGPLFAPLFAVWLMHEKIRPNNIIGILISSTGVAMVLFAGNKNFDIGSVWGVMFAFFAVFCAVLYSIILKRMPLEYNSLTVVFYVQLFGLLMFIPTWAMLDGAEVVSQLPQMMSSEYLSNAVLDLLYMGILASVCAFVMFCFTIRQLGVTKANIFNNFAPVFTALMMLVFFGERLPIAKWVGIVVVIVGLFICQMYLPKHAK